MFGKKKKSGGGHLSDVLTKDERLTLITYLGGVAVNGATEGIRNACAGMIKVVERDEYLMPDSVRGLINVCNAIGEATGNESEANAIVRKLKQLL